jgi:hypothetical protein
MKAAMLAFPHLQDFLSMMYTSNKFIMTKYLNNITYIISSMDHCYHKRTKGTGVKKIGFADCIRLIT